MDDKMSNIKFIQAVRNSEDVLEWQPWGYLHTCTVGLPVFIGPMGSVEWDLRPSYRYACGRDMGDKEIYDGHIVEIHYHHIPDKKPVLGLVQWSDYSAGFHIIGKDGGTYSVCFETGGDWGDERAVKIIGHIEENPELWKINKEENQN